MKFIAVLLLVLVATAASEPRFHDHIVFYYCFLTFKK